jgi:hypothetical protein
MEQRLEQLQLDLHHLAYSTPSEKIADTLQDKIEEMIHEGHSRENLYEALKRLALELRSDGRDDLEEEVMDVMDIIVGWCAPSARL